MSKTIKRFIWFTTHSWLYMKGLRRNFFAGFWSAWRNFNTASREDDK